MNWQDANEGPIWMPELTIAENEFGIPSHLLARVAFEESSFRAEVIDGTVSSKAGCVGIMQLNPVYFPGAGVSAEQDIERAAAFLAGLYARFSDWQVALAAYNWGGGNVHHEFALNADRYILADMPMETQNYVRQICADVPVPGVLL